MNWEAIGGICGIIGIIGMYYQFYYLPKASLKEAKINLLAQYSTSQKVIDNLILDIETYVQLHNCQNEYFSQGVTFGSYILYLKNIRKTELNEQLSQNILSSIDLSVDNLSVLRSSLEKQILSFNQSQAHFDTVFKFKMF